MTDSAAEQLTLRSTEGTLILHAHETPTGVEFSVPAGSVALTGAQATALSMFLDAARSKRHANARYVEQARARKAELIRQVREGTPPLWTPKPGWADAFTDDEIWEGWSRVAADKQLTTVPMMVAATLVGDVLDGKHA